MTRFGSLFVAFFFALLATWPSSVPAVSTPEMVEIWPGPTWRTVTPASQGIDSSAIDLLVRRIRSGQVGAEIHSLLIVRGGHLVIEEYFDGWNAKRLHTLQSVSKSVTSALIGIAVDRGEIESTDEKVLSFFPGLLSEIRHLDQRKQAMTLEDLLTMKTGSEFHERGSDSPLHRMNRLQRGWLKFVLDSRMRHEPGTRFHYDSGGVILLSGVLKATTGLFADVYADQYLFGPLGIEESRWFKNAEGLPHTGGGLYLRPRDLARFGLLYLRRGRWQDRQVVSAEWIDRSLRRQVATVRQQDGRDVGYGFLWWVWPPPADRPELGDFYAGHGFMGQYVFVVPSLDLVVVFTGGSRTWSGEKRPAELVYEYILPATRPLG
ncbi:MAG: beta-lactamase family protein [Thermoanaerobaculia bacterium]|nr:beta-lactamase family protein [Thermoanaerobaculia bacterium]